MLATTYDCSVRKMLECQPKARVMMHDVVFIAITVLLLNRSACEAFVPHIPGTCPIPTNKVYWHVASRQSCIALSLAASAWKQHADSTTISSDCKLTADDIENLIKKRNKARRSRNFSLADEILANLNSNNVYLDDGRKLWRADGNTFESVSTYGKAVNSKEISKENEVFVVKRLEERTRAKSQNDYDKADDILDELRFLMNVAVDDKNKTWRVTDPFKTMYTYGGQRLNNVPRDTLKQIEQLVRDRSDAKKKKNYGRADEILNDLRIHFGVRVDDNKKAWYFMQRSREERKAKTKKDRKSKKKPTEDKVSDWSVVQVDGNSSTMPEGVSVSGSEDDVPVVPEDISIIDVDPCENAHPPVLHVQSRQKLELCTVPQLKDKLREAGLIVSGRKADLIHRLVENE